MSEATPPHLGGHCGITHTDRGALEFMRDVLKAEPGITIPRTFTMLDVGCGPGGQVALAREVGFNAMGIDGDPAVQGDGILRHDFSAGRWVPRPIFSAPVFLPRAGNLGPDPPEVPRPGAVTLIRGGRPGWRPVEWTGPGRLEYDPSVDLVWSVEFLEHVEERFIPNFLPLFKMARYVVLTHALPGQPGGPDSHHVNLQTPDYWRGVMASVGLHYSEALTKGLRSRSTMEREFIQSTGAVFTQGNLGQ